MDFAKVSAAIGIEIRGIDLTKPVSDEGKRTLKDLFDREALLVFRGQKMTKQDIVACTPIFGEWVLSKGWLTAVPTASQAG